MKSHYTLKQAAEYLGMSYRGLVPYVVRGHLPVIRINPKMYLVEADQLCIFESKYRRREFDGRKRLRKDYKAQEIGQ
jgi:predicted site-specific integrase-resolvase